MKVVVFLSALAISASNSALAIKLKSAAIKTNGSNSSAFLRKNRRQLNTPPADDGDFCECPTSGTQAYELDANCETPCVAGADCGAYNYKACGEFTFSRSMTVVSPNDQTDQCDWVDTVMVTDPTSPTVTCVSDQELKCGQTYKPAATAEETKDNCDIDDATPNTMETFTNHGYCSDTVPADAPEVTYTARDTCGQEGSCKVTVSYIPDETSPEVECPDAYDFDVCGGTFVPKDQEGVSATDDCGEVSLDYPEEKYYGACEDAIEDVFTYTATDGCGNTGTCDQTVTKKKKDLTPPDFHSPCPEDISLCEGDSISPEALAATDNCPDNTVMSKVEPTSITMQCAQAKFTYTATDECGNPAMCTQTIKPDSTPPVFDFCPAAYEVDVCGGTFKPMEQDASAKDDCKVSLEYPDQKEYGACDASDPSGDVFTYTATDGCNTVTCDQTVTKHKDSTPPEFDIDSLPDDVLHECPGPNGFTFSPGTPPPARDNCPENTLVHTNTGPVTVYCDESETIEYTVSDGCNEATHKQTIIANTPAPVCANDPTTLVSTCDPNWQDNLLSLGVGLFTDQCYDPTEGDLSGHDDLSGVTLSCDRNNPVHSWENTVTYTRPDANCEASKECTELFEVDCTEDTAFGYLTSDNGVIYGNKEYGFQKNWGWGVFVDSFSESGEDVFEFDMYGGAAQEDPNGGTFVGTVSLSVSTTGIAVEHQVCNSAVAADFHVSVVPLRGDPLLGDIHTLDDCASAQPLRPPGNYNCNDFDACAGCEAGKPCCLAVHWATDYDTCLKDEVEQALCKASMS